MAKITQFTADVREWPHVASVRRKAVKMAKEAGFSDKEAEEISISVTELAENLIEHQTVEGKIICSLIEEGSKRGIQIISEDCGPGIKDVMKAIQDGYSGKGSLGIGLGAVKRLMSEFDITSKTDKSAHAEFNGSREGIGTVIVARKWLYEKKTAGLIEMPCTSFGVFSRPKMDEMYNGDSFFLQHFDGKTIVAVIDGVGHGLYAHEASHEAYVFLTDNYRDPLDVIINKMHLRLKRTRGAAISIALIDETNGTMDYVGIGNVLTRLFKTDKPANPANYNGMVGASLQKFRVLHYPWSNRNVIIMTSDGISAKYDLNEYPGLVHKKAVIIADVILRDFGRSNDDATIIVGGPARL